MIYHKIEEIKNEFNFLSSKDFEKYEKFFHKIFKLTFNYKIINFEELKKNNISCEIITLDPEIYNNLKNTLNISLFVFSTDKHFSHFFNLAKYIDINKITNKEDLKYKEYYFNNFLWNFFPDQPKKNKIIKLINKLKLNFFKFYINKKIWFPLIRYDENIFKGIKIGYSTNNNYMAFNKLLKRDLNFISNFISDKESKKIFNTTVFGKPNDVKKQYFNMLNDYDQYLHHLNFNNCNIINLGVAEGFEIPFFLTHNINKILNIDPSGEDYLNEYVKRFVKLYKDKIIFDKRYIYSNDKLWVKSNMPPSNLIEIIEDYGFNSNILIKADIEGLEINLVDELEIIINKFRPQLAISIYHTDQSIFPIHSHLTLIPKRIIEIALNYNFYIKHYSYNRRETIFYAIPKEKKYGK